MLLRTAFLLIPTLLMAQTPAAEAPKPAAPSSEPPAEVDQALRARAKEFLQYHVDGNYRKAYDMVSEDSKDFYFGMTKAKYSSFELTGIEYGDNFTTAEVKSMVKRTVTFAKQQMDVPMPTADWWKIQDGKWMWARQERKEIVTPWGIVPFDPTAKSGAIELPKDLSPAAAMEAAKQVSVKATLSKEKLSFTAGTAGSDEVVFHNGLNGAIHLLATPIFDLGAFKAEPSEADVGPGKEVTIVVHYDPAGSTTEGPELRLTVEPFDEAYYVPLVLTKPAR